MKNKNALIGIIVVVVVIIAGGGFFLLNKSKSNNSTANTTVNQTSATVGTRSPKDIGLTLSASPDNKKVQFSVDNLSDITAISYELTYQADSTLSEKQEGADATVQRGITGDAKLTSGSYTSPWLDLGTCSSGTCHYDTGVTSVDLILKVTKGGKDYQVEQKLSLQ